jgi:redox-sensitive bicupin YhaK (pirin superfamily)
MVLYVGEPQNERIIQRGPFVAGSDAELAAYFQAYRNGQFERISRLT